MGVFIYEKIFNFSINYDKYCKCRMQQDNSIKDKLLEPFIKYNIYEESAKEISSSGLGLYLCRELVRKNNGELSYEIKGEEINFILKFNLNKT